MNKVQNNSGGIEYIKSPDEKDSDAKIKELKLKHKGKKEGDLSASEVKELVFIIAKHLRIL